jgi:hypothetical protein
VAVAVRAGLVCGRRGRRLVRVERRLRSVEAWVGESRVLVPSVSTDCCLTCGSRPEGPRLRRTEGRGLGVGANSRTELVVVVVVEGWR